MSRSSLVDRSSIRLQDFLTSAFLLTNKDRFYTRADMGRLCAFMGDALILSHLPIPAVCKPIEMWTGKQVFSMLVRPNSETRYQLCLS